MKDFDMVEAENIGLRLEISALRAENAKLREVLLALRDDPATPAWIATLARIGENERDVRDSNPQPTGYKTEDFYCIWCSSVHVIADKSTWCDHLLPAQSQNDLAHQQLRDPCDAVGRPLPPWALNEK